MHPRMEWFMMLTHIDEDQLRETAGKKKPVELRKMVTNFVNFIKATTKFYRGFIQRLASHFGVCELEPVVEQFKLTSEIYILFH